MLNKFMKQFKSKKGFTLIELMIVVAIIGILAAIAIPNFIRYQLRSKTTEAKVVLGGIKTSEESFRAELDNYSAAAATPAAIPGTVKTAWAPTACLATCSRTQPANCAQFSCIGYQPAGQVYYQYAVATRLAAAAQTAEYGSGARADLDGDTNNGSFAYRTANQVAATTGLVADGITDCAAGVNAGEVTDCKPNVY